MYNPCTILIRYSIRHSTILSIKMHPNAPSKIGLNYSPPNKKKEEIVSLLYTANKSIENLAASITATFKSENFPLSAENFQK